MPRPTMRMRSPFFRCLVILPTMSVRMASAAFFDSSWASARSAARCLSVTVVGVAAFFAISGPPRWWNGLSALVDTGLRRENASRGDLNPKVPIQPERGGLQETQAYQALNDSGGGGPRCFA